MDLDTKLKAFVPEFIPAIGEVDAFLKMPRPDGQPETLGLYVLVKMKLVRMNHHSISPTRPRSTCNLSTRIRSIREESIPKFMPFKVQKRILSRSLSGLTL